MRAGGFITATKRLNLEKRCFGAFCVSRLLAAFAGFGVPERVSYAKRHAAVAVAGFERAVNVAKEQARFVCTKQESTKVCRKTTFCSGRLSL